MRGRQGSPSLKGVRGVSVCVEGGWGGDGSGGGAGRGSPSTWEKRALASSAAFCADLGRMKMLGVESIATMDSICGARVRHSHTSCGFPRAARVRKVFGADASPPWRRARRQTMKISTQIAFDQEIGTPPPPLQSHALPPPRAAHLVGAVELGARHEHLGELRVERELPAPPATREPRQTNARRSNNATVECLRAALCSLPLEEAAAPALLSLYLSRPPPPPPLPLSL